jgi:hypothetical protein
MSINENETENRIVNIVGTNNRYQIKKVTKQLEKNMKQKRTCE